MHYVILRDDDTNALTPPECLERLYRPFLSRCLPVNLAVIPEVATGTVRPGGEPEGYLLNRNGNTPAFLPVSGSPALLHYLRANPGYHIVQHGCHHDYLEFESQSGADIRRRLDRGRQLLRESGFGEAETFVAPYDRISRTALGEIVKRFQVLSTGWFEWRRIPWGWWPRYLLKRGRRAPHWSANGSILLSHPGCLLSCHRAYDSMLETVVRSVRSRSLTVLVTHWWEYFRGNRPDETLIEILHQTADFLACDSSIQVLSFSELARFPRLLSGAGPMR